MTSKLRQPFLFGSYIIFSILFSFYGRSELAFASEDSIAALLKGKHATVWMKPDGNIKGKIDVVSHYKELTKKDTPALLVSHKSGMLLEIYFDSDNSREDYEKFAEQEYAIDASSCLTIARFLGQNGSNVIKCHRDQIKFVKSVLSSAFQILQPPQTSTSKEEVVKSLGNYNSVALCFIGETKIRMGDGCEKSIDSINPGDKVASFNERLSEYNNVSSPTQWETKIQADAKNYGDAIVTMVFENPAPQKLLTLITENNQSVTSTINHRMIILEKNTVKMAYERKFLGAGEILPGQYMLSFDEANAGGGTPVKLLQSELISNVDVSTSKPIFEKIYNLELQRFHTYFANDILVHNISN